MQSFFYGLVLLYNMIFAGSNFEANDPRISINSQLCLIDQAGIEPHLKIPTLNETDPSYLMAMSKEVVSKIIGPLKQDENFEDWWKSQPVKIPFFDDRAMIITFMDFDLGHDKTFIDEADQALTIFFKQTSIERNSISDLAFKNCMEFLDAVGFDESDEQFRKIRDQREIWNFIHPTEIYVTRRHRRDCDIYIQIACECDWEQEHGLQLVFRQGKKLTRISDQDGHLTEADAYDKPDRDDELLSRF